MYQSHGSYGHTSIPTWIVSEWLLEEGSFNYWVRKHTWQFETGWGKTQTTNYLQYMLTFQNTGMGRERVEMLAMSVWGTFSKTRPRNVSISFIPCLDNCHSNTRKPQASKHLKSLIESSDSIPLNLAKLTNYQLDQPGIVPQMKRGTPYLKHI